MGMAPRDSSRCICCKSTDVGTPVERVVMPTDKPQNGTWVLVAPDGRKYEAESPIRCCRAEQNERISERVRIARLLAFAFDESGDCEEDEHY